ncbi:zinc finger BED domain-containing protein RICESLEEPER 1-like [Castanea sativa]|uniref:zinc finger BED domain-containing protein RICESLEEPER 1-like n=1 Tax=Castanea sativa TaxID=21020 RepID=UPI003F64A019
MVVTAHFIDGDWTYQKKILNFCPIANHKGDTIGRAVESCLLKWGIDRLFTITADNASSNDVAIDYVKKKTKERDSGILGGEFIHMRCFAHILNLIVQSGLKSIHESIAKVRNAVRYVRASPARFYEATLRFSGSLFVTSNTYFHELISIEDQLQQLCSVDGDPLLKSMAIEMKKKYDKYWGSMDNINLMLFVAVVLDPRYRLKYVKFWFREWYRKDKGDEMSSKVRDALKRLYVERVGQNGASSSSGSGASLSKDSMPSVGNASLSDHIKSYNNRFKQHLADEDSVKSKFELDRYLLESSEDPDVEDFDILMWWKMNSSRYRVLS